MRYSKIFFILLCLIVSIQFAHAQTYYACKGCGGYGYTNNGSSLCSYCDGYCTVEENSWGYKELTNRGYNLFYTPTAKNSNGEYTRSKWNTSTRSYEKQVFKNGQFVRTGESSSSTVSGSYNGSYNSGNGNYNGGNVGGTLSENQRGTSTQSRPQTAKDCGVCHGTGKCQTCNGSGRAYNLFDLGTHQCVNCKSNVGKCQWCRGTGKAR